MAENDEIDRILALLRLDPPETVRQRSGEVGAILDSRLGNGSSFFLALLKRAIESDARSTPELLDLVSYLTEADLDSLIAFLVPCLLDRGDVTGELEEDLLGHVACQKPDRIPRELLESIYDFRQWFERADPVSPSPTYHMVFECGSPTDLPFETHRQHPTWHFDRHVAGISIGGRGSGKCPACRIQLNHLLTLEQVPPDLGVSLPELVFETCPYSSGIEYFQHDENGRPKPVTPYHECGFENADAPLATMNAKLAVTPDRWKRQSWGISNGRENLFKFGGLPSWVQYADTPVVPDEDRKMQFLFQLDSFLPAADGGEVLWGSGGLLYAFWDDRTRISCIFRQGT